MRRRIASWSLWVALLLTAAAAVSNRPASSTPPSMTRDEIICRAQSGVGFSYWWGGECWCRSGCSPNYGCGTGDCVRTGSSGCPSQCYHTGSYGADCSGFVSKCWQVPNPVSTEACHVDRYTASAFHAKHSYWDIISRSALQRGDAMASTTHVVLFEARTSTGGYTVYEAAGCDDGIIHRTRSSMSSSYTAARRINIASTTCDCSPGEVQEQSCGDCGTRTRTCRADCTWGTWSDCTGEGVCGPGAMQTEACGNCGTRSRTCQSSCTWGTWSDCTGEGPCSPGRTESQSCCDCGTQERTCESDCRWSDWGACRGPDPDGGTRVCDTGEPGVCAEGIVRCMDGCTRCVRISEPSPELCDALDNDCNGAVDEGRPQTLGTPPPPYAAALIDMSNPSTMAAAGEGAAWLVFENAGAEPWLPGQVWLASVSALEGGVSRLYHAASWRSWDVPAVLDETVDPGETALLAFTLGAPLEAIGPIEEEFVLLGPDGDMMRCPTPSATLSVTITDSDGGDFNEIRVDVPALEGGCSCSLAVY